MPFPSEDNTFSPGEAEGDAFPPEMIWSEDDTFPHAEEEEDDDVCALALNNDASYEATNSA